MNDTVRNKLEILDLQREIRDRRKLGQPTAALVEALREMEKEVKRNEL